MNYSLFILLVLYQFLSFLLLHLDGPIPWTPHQESSRGSRSQGRVQQPRSRGNSSSTRGRSQEECSVRARSCSRGRGRGRSSRGRGRGSRGRGHGRGRPSSSNSTNDLWAWNQEKNESNTIADVPFTGDIPGPINEAIGITDPLELFHLLIPDDFYDEILVETNRYAEQQRQLKNDTSPWNPISKEELKAFIGLIIAMGIISLPDSYDYWSTEPMMCHSWFRLVMSRNRFREILRYIHLVDNTTAPQRTAQSDKLWKVRPLLNVLSRNAPKLYSLHRQISIDESMIGTKSRLSFLQYMPKKPTKWGIKVWVCCDARTGYIYSFDVYTGADPSIPKSSNGQAYDVVMNLLSSLFGKGHILYTDNLHSSPQLFYDLLQKLVLASGTVRKNRKKFPKNLDIASKLSRGESKFIFFEHLTVCRWFDNKDVFCISTVLSDTITTIKRRVEKQLKDVICPDIIVDYNQHMGGVDLADQAMCYYSVGRKSLKWWRRVFWRMHDQAITNAFVLHKANSISTGIVKPQKHFRIQLAYALTSRAFEIRRHPGRPHSTVLSRLSGKHFVYKSTIRKRCMVCVYKKQSPRSKKYKDKKIKTWCPKCNVHLCIGKCFEAYHVRLNYKKF